MFKCKRLNLFYSTSKHPPSYCTVITRLGLKYIPNCTLYQHQQQMRYDLSQILSQLPKKIKKLVSVDCDKTINIILTYIFKMYQKRLIINASVYKPKNLTFFDFKQIKLLNRHPFGQLLMLDKNCGYLWLERDVLKEAIEKILNDDNAFTVLNESESMIINECKVSVLFFYFINIKNSTFFSMVQKSDILTNILECNRIPIMLPIPKLKQLPLQWRPILRMSPNWLTNQLQKYSANAIMKLVHFANLKTKQKLIKLRQQKQ